MALNTSEDPRLQPPHSAIGFQHNSKKETQPAYSFGTGSRETATKKVFISAKHEKLKAPAISQGPVYNVPSSVGASPKFSFGSDEQRKHLKAKYPDSSVDLTCSTVDSQGLKFHSTKGIHFGTESRGGHKNAETVRIHPGLALGLDAPGALEYEPEKAEPKTARVAPEYSFGPNVKADKKDKADPSKIKPVSRLQIPATGTPRCVGPGSHVLEHSVGRQPKSARPSAPAYSFGGSPRLGELKKDGQLFDISPDLSSLGKQVVSTQKSMPKAAFGEATRDRVARTQLVMCEADRGPAAQMPKPNFHFDLPKASPGRPLAKCGM